MEMKPFLLLTKQCTANWCANSLVFRGEMPNAQEIKFNELPSFIDALHLLQHYQQQDATPYQTIPFTGAIHEPYTIQNQNAKLIIQPNALQLIDQDQALTNENVYDLFKHFMVKKKNRILFIADCPNRKISTEDKDEFSTHEEKKELKKYPGH